MQNRINWFELFVTDLKRAQPFYEAIFETKLKSEDFNGEPNAYFNQDSGNLGALVQRKGRKPSAEGALLYFNCNGTLDACLARVVPNGGKIVMPKTDIGAPGFIGLVSDTEGNLIGLYAERV